MNCILRGVRVIDPVAHLDAAGQDVWLSEGRIIAIYKHIGEGTLPVIDLTPAPGATPCILCPGFIDLHAHLREPGDEQAETMQSGARAAAAGGFTHVVAMANTDPPIDSPERVRDAGFRAVAAPVQVLTAAALTRDLAGERLVDMAGCAAAGAVAFTDDGRNAASPRLLSAALRETSHVSRPVMVHPEHEETILAASGKQDAVTRCLVRPVEAETRAVDLAVRALSHAGSGRLHLQHLSSAAAIDLLRRARDRGLPVTAEVSPHHLAMWTPVGSEPDPPALLKVNPPLRSERDRVAVVQALREGLIEAVATDHAPHSIDAKTCGMDEAAAGMTGLETALSTCITLGAMSGDWIPVLVERLTAGPYRVLGEASGLREPRLRIGEAATCVLFDPAAEWTVGETAPHSLSRNTPLWGVSLRGRVLLTIMDGAVVHHDVSLLPWPASAAEAVVD